VDACSIAVPADNSFCPSAVFYSTLLLDSSQLFVDPTNPFRAERFILVFLILVGCRAPCLASLDLLLFAQLPGFNEDVAWVGTALGILSIAAVIWAHVSLGDSWSANVEEVPGHTLRRHGAYACARHPSTFDGGRCTPRPLPLILCAVYTAFMMQPVTLALVTQNYAFVGLWSLWIIYAGVRVRDEEKLMLSLFGEEYASYRYDVGAFGPRCCLCCCGRRGDCGLTDDEITAELAKRQTLGREVGREGHSGLVHSLPSIAERSSLLAGQ